MLENTTETMLLRTPNEILRISAVVNEEAAQRLLQIDDAVFLPERFCQRKR